MKKEILFSCFVLLLFSACSSSKSTNKGESDAMNTVKTTQSPVSNRPQKMAETEKSPEQRAIEQKETKPAMPAKVQTSKAKTFEAAPSVPDSL